MNPFMCKQRSLLIIIITLLLPGNVRPALAHGYLLRSIPEDRAVLERAPARLQYWFSEGLEARFSSLTVRDQAGNIIATGGLAEDNNALLVARLPRSLPHGIYIVDLRIAFASDGHVIAQTRTFSVGQAISQVETGQITTQANGLEVLWRTLVLSSTMLLFGTLVIYQAVLLPAWGNPLHRAGLLPPRVMRRLNTIIFMALVIALLGNILALLQQTMSFFDTDVTQVISQNLWSVTRAATRFGELWNARMLFLGLAAVMFGLSIYWRKEHPDTVRPFWEASAWVMALIIGTFSAGSHAAGSLTLPWLAVFNDWLHALGVGLWVGGLGALALALPVALAPYQGDEQRQALLAALKRFSRLAVACVAVVVTTGLYSATNWIYTPSDMTSTTFGGALILKLLLVGGLLLVGLAHHMALRPERYQKWQGVTRRVSNFIPSLRLEYGLALATLTSAGLLSATPVPIPYFIQDSIPSPSATQIVDDLSISLTITPGGAGVNTYDTLVLRDGQPVDDLSLQLQMVNPERDQRSAWASVENAEGGLYIGAGAEIDRTGKWWSLLDLKLPDGTVKRAAFEWNITVEAAIQQTQPAGLQHLVALCAVIGALGWVVYPGAYRFYRQLDLNPVNVTVVVGAILGTIVLSAAGFIVIQNTQNQFEATLNPPPQNINTVLPDAQSLARGKVLYEQQCVGWQTINLNTFSERLPRTRDEQLFALTRDGSQDIPACEGTLSDSQRWDVVNFIRTFRQ